MSPRARLRRLAFGLATLLGGKPRGYFIPYRHADRLPPRAGRSAYHAVEALFEGARPAFRETLAGMEALRENLLAIGEEPSPQPRWTQAWYPRLDAAAAYALIRQRAPRKVIEVGSGHSTRFICRALADGDLETEVTAIDPAPRADIARLPATVIRSTVQEVDPALFAGLKAGDMVMVDSSHILMPGSDVDFLLGHVVPRMPPGSLLCFHDIFLPDDYPADWAWRGYNEQLGVLALLLGDAWRPIFSSHYVATRMAGEWSGGVLDALALIDGAHESALWLERR